MTLSVQTISWSPKGAAWPFEPGQSGRPVFRLDDAIQLRRAERLCAHWAENLPGLGFLPILDSDSQRFVKRFVIVLPLLQSERGNHSFVQLLIKLGMVTPEVDLQIAGTFPSSDSRKLFIVIGRAEAAQVASAPGCRALPGGHGKLIWIAYEDEPLDTIKIQSAEERS